MFPHSNLPQAYTPKFNSSPLKNHGWKMNLLLGFPILRGYVKFPGRNHPLFFYIGILLVKCPCQLWTARIWVDVKDKAEWQWNGSWELLERWSPNKPIKNDELGWHLTTIFRKKSIGNAVQDFMDPCFFLIFHIGDRQTRCQGWKIHSREMLNLKGQMIGPDFDGPEIRLRTWHVCKNITKNM